MSLIPEVVALPELSLVEISDEEQAILALALLGIYDFEEQPPAPGPAAGFFLPSSVFHPGAFGITSVAVGGGGWTDMARGWSAPRVRFEPDRQMDEDPPGVVEGVGRDELDALVVPEVEQDSPYVFEPLEPELPEEPQPPEEPEIVEKPRPTIAEILKSRKRLFPETPVRSVRAVRQGQALGQYFAGLHGWFGGAFLGSALADLTSESAPEEDRTEAGPATVLKAVLGTALLYHGFKKVKSDD